MSRRVRLGYVDQVLEVCMRLTFSRWRKISVGVLAVLVYCVTGGRTDTWIGETVAMVSVAWLAAGAVAALIYWVLGLRLPRRGA